MEYNTINEKKKSSLKLSELATGYVALKIYTKRNNVQGMYRNLQKLKPIYKKKPSYYYRLAKLAYRQKMWKQSLNYINKAIEQSNGSSHNYYLCKANSLIHLKESKKAIDCLKAYLSNHPSDAQAMYLLANEHNKIHQSEKTVEAYESYLKLIPEDSKASFQLGECYRQLEKYEQAEASYLNATKNLDNKQKDQSLAISYYWLGLMQLKNNHSQEADHSFQKVIELDQQLNSKRFGIGVFHEHFKQWEYALDAYEDQLSKNTEDAELMFTIASMLDGRSQPEHALAYYQAALRLDNILSPWHYALANCYEQLEDYQNAAKWYKSAIARQVKHRPGNYRRLGFVLNKLGRTREALDAYNEAELFRRPSDMKQPFYKKHITKARVRYAVYYEHYQVDEQMIFYTSLSGARLMGNPYAIFEYIINHEDFKNYTHVWVVNSFHVIPEEFRSMENIIFVKKKSDAYFKYITTAKYLICNSTFEPYVVRKPDQLYLQTSHGIFYKTVGRDSVNTPIGVAGGTRNLLQATHIIVPNEFMAEKQPKSYSIEGINDGAIAKIGYPRIDVTLNMTDDAKRQIASKLGAHLDKKIVFYAPTWRGSSKSQSTFDSNRLVHDLRMLAELDVNVVFRGHTISNSLLKKVTLPDNVIVPPPDIQTNELLGIADVLISDYSSVFFDFLVREKPIVHYLYDLDEYMKERGLNLGLDELPGSIAENSQQLFTTVADKIKNDKPSSHYLAVKDRFCPYDDGRSAERVVKWLFYENSSDVSFVDRNKTAKSLLYLGGMLDENTEIANFVNELKDQQKNDNVLSVLLNKDVSKDNDKVEMLAELKPNVNFIVYDKNMPMTLEEAAAINYFQAHKKFASERMEDAYQQAYQREVRRLFGDSSFNHVVNYDTTSDYCHALQENIQEENAFV